MSRVLPQKGATSFTLAPRILRMALWAAAVALPGCSTDVAGPSSDFGGIHYTAQVQSVASGGVPLLNVIVTLQNTGGGTQTRTYPAACPVRVQLFRQSDNALLYDETRLPCDQTVKATLTLLGLASTTLSSGVRFPGTIAGDSLPLVTYTVRCVVLTEGTANVVLNAGSFNLVSGPAGLRAGTD